MSDDDNIAKFPVKLKPAAKAPLTVVHTQMGEFADG